MKIIDNFLEELNYYKLICETQTEPEILQLELKDLIFEINNALIKIQE